HLIDTYNIHFPIVHDPTDYTRDIYEVTGFPFSYIVDQGGRIIGRVIGAYDWESPEIEALVKQLLTHQSSKNHERQN
ncbi:MAG TPA: hypothetical protein DCZ03_13010, partial [Gammaproteobacteria bacterium]|nr:hypothetical protein [Gammaproteobacteria bacterium]